MLCEMQAQAVVMRQQADQCRLQVHGIQADLGLEHQRLVPVVPPGNVALEESRLDRQQRLLAADLRRRFGRRFFLDQPGYRRQLADGLFLEQLLGTQLDPLALGPGDDLQAEDRVAAQFEEVVGGADPLQLEHIGPDRRQFLLDLAHRRGVLLLDRARPGQGTLVELAVGGQRQLLQQQDLRRDHVVAEQRLQLSTQHLDLQHRAHHRHAIGHQLQPTGIVVHWQGQHRRLGYRLETLQHPRDFRRLDAITTDFHLVVVAPDEFQQSLAIATDPVAAAVAAGARHTMGIRQETLGRQPRLPEIPQGDTLATDVQLARHLFGDDIEHVIQHIGPCARQRPANRNPSLQRVARQHFVAQYAHGGFAGTIVVDEAAARLELAHLPHQRRRTGFAADNQGVGRQYIRRAGRLQQRRQMPGDDLQDADAVRGHVVGKTVRVEPEGLGQHMQGAPGTQGAEQHGMPEVGGNGRDQRHAGIRCQCQAARQAIDITGQRSMADQDALGLTGGAGGVNHIGRGLARQRQQRRAVRLVEPQRRLKRLADASRHGKAHGTRVAFGTQQQPCPGTLQQLPQAGVGRLGIQRHIHRAGLENPQDAGQPVQRALHQHRHRFATAHARVTQMMGQAIGGLVQLDKAQGLFEAARGHCPRLAPDLGLPLLQHRQRRFAYFGKRRRRAAMQAEQRRLRGLQDRIEQLEQPRDKPLDGRMPIQVAGVGHLTVDQRAVIGDIQGQVEVSTVLVQRVFGHAQARQLHRTLFLHADVLVELGLEQRVVIQVALRSQGVHQLFERQLLVGLGAKTAFAQASQQVEETLAFVDLTAQDLGIDEKPDQALDLRTTAVGIRHADADIALPGMTREKQRIAAQHQHEQAHPLAAGKGLQLPGTFGAEIEPQGPAFEALHRRTGKVGGDIQQGLRLARCRQLLAPVIQLSLALAGFQPAALPDRIVGVLQRQFRQAGCAPQAEGLIGLDEFLDHHVHRPAVGDDMVHAHHQYPLVRGEADQAGAQQRPLEQVERLRGEGPDPRGQFGLTLPGGAIGQVDALQRYGLGREDHLPRLLAVDLEQGPQDFMALDDMLEGTQ